MSLLRLATGRAVLTFTGRVFRGGAVVQGPARTSSVALTFDDGPDPRWTPGILEALERTGARATFFIVGRQALRNPDLVCEIGRRGHELGTHLFTHRREVVSRDDLFRDELERSLQLLSDLTGRPIRMIRFPYGQRGRQRVKRLGERGLRVVHWTFSSLDSRLARPEDIVRRTSTALRPGAILLLHDGIADADSIAPPYLPRRDATLEAMPAILDLLAERKLAAVTLSRLLGYTTSTE